MNFCINRLSVFLLRMSSVDHFFLVLCTCILQSVYRNAFAISFQSHRCYEIMNAFCINFPFSRVWRFAVFSIASFLPSKKLDALSLFTAQTKAVGGQYPSTAGLFRPELFISLLHKTLFDAFNHAIFIEISSDNRFSNSHANSNSNSLTLK